MKQSFKVCNSVSDVMPVFRVLVLQHFRVFGVEMLNQKPVLSELFSFYSYPLHRPGGKRKESKLIVKGLIDRNNCRRIEHFTLPVCSVGTSCGTEPTRLP